MSTYVLVHGAWHTGELFEDVAAPIRAAGHVVHCPTVAGNAPGDDRRQGLAPAVASIVTYLEDNDLSDVILLGHSYGGMVITGVADRVPGRIRRLIYWNAFVPSDGECLNDMVPPHYVDLFDQVAAASDDNSVMLPYPIWREAFINDAPADLAQSAFDRLNPHPYATFTDKIALSKNPAEFECAKSYINCTEDTALPQSLGWHPRLSEKLGLFRLVQIPGSHEICFSDPAALADAIMIAGRD
ncbi:alpha/beta fold hydrolase [Chachezhania sediminis]|uniref:alpha/beta fold hydrolase n=1 Tax=Chachezhania sediminis TaxID=2599291 RepID=UPI00131B7AB8|nr:alpha/beta hydrolase [Chachezhania sediminis]